MTTKHELNRTHKYKTGWFYHNSHIKGGYDKTNDALNNLVWKSKITTRIFDFICFTMILISNYFDIP